MKETLEQLGITGKKADVYLATLELGSATTIEIAKKSGIKRTTCYDILLDLKKDGIVTESRKKNKRLFVGIDPEKILKKLKEKEKKFMDILPELKSIYNIKKGKPKISFYEGIQGLADVSNDTLNYKGPILAFAGKEIFKVMGQTWTENYWKQRRLRNIHVKAIVPKTDIIIREVVKNNIRDLRTTKLVDVDKYPFSIEIDIYGNQKVAFISYNEEVAVIIEAKEIYNTMRSIFELLWDHLPNSPE